MRSFRHHSLSNSLRDLVVVSGDRPLYLDNQPKQYNHLRRTHHLVLHYSVVKGNRMVCSVVVCQLHFLNSNCLRQSQ